MYMKIVYASKQKISGRDLILIFYYNGKRNVVLLRFFDAK